MLLFGVAPSDRQLHAVPYEENSKQIHTIEYRIYHFIGITTSDDFDRKALNSVTFLSSARKVHLRRLEGWRG
jgi:hypothetical protein